MLVSIILVLAFLIFFSIVLSENYNKYKFSFGVCSLFLVGLGLIAVFRPGYALPDYNNYVDFYHMRGEERFEPSAKLLRLISPNVKIFFLYYAVIAIACKIKACTENSSLPLFSMITYLCTSFVTHELVQIRVSCAVGIFLLSVRYLANNKRVIYFICILLAGLFHYSALVFLFFIFFNNQKFNKYFWLFMLLLSYVFGVLRIDVITPVIINFSSQGYVIATIISHADEWVNIFNINQLLRITIFIFLSMNAKKICKKDSLFYLKIKIFAVSLILLPLLQTYPLLSGRLSELIGTIIILLLPDIIFCFQRRSLGYLFFLLYSIMFFGINVILNLLVNF